MNKQKVCCFTGHRPQKLPFGLNEQDERCIRLKEALREEIVRMIQENGVTDFISGMAIGTDVFAAEIVLELKKQYPQLWLECTIPCENQAAKWREADRDRYFDIISRCDKETLLQTRYTPDCMQNRNKYMVDKSDYVIAVWDGTPSGTGNTMRYAKKCDKEVIIINPREM